MTLEIIATTLSDAIQGEKAGADRIELVTGIAEGGLTPSYALIESVCEETNIPVNVMIRPHSASFCYDSDDMKTVIRDIQICKQLGADGIVFGSLTEEGKIDESSLQKVLEEADHLDFTFHRAFDEVDNQEEALEVLMKYKQISRVLTSGGKKTAPDATEEIQVLVEKSRDSHIEILAGSGLNLNNTASFLNKVKVKELHFGSGVRKHSNFAHPIDQEKVDRIKKIMMSHA
ncbi:copper homeostasis protein CutC [Jeotgalibacillus marinus]|uniref:PF03932 family protein CutC n=1 Tax=Jeotgalibacillus marinus TaxID=86667 RepID=A0ABV3Q590_9BACL